MSKGRKHKKGHDGGHENAERWLLTYADLITLLMVFFVVLYAMSQADSSKFKRISAALQQAFNVDVLQGQSAISISEGASKPSPPVDDLISATEVPQLARLKAKIDSIIDGATQAPDVSVGTDREGVVIRL